MTERQCARAKVDPLIPKLTRVAEER